MLPGPPPSPNWPGIHCAVGCALPQPVGPAVAVAIRADDLEAERRGLPEIDVRDRAVVERDREHLAHVARPRLVGRRRRDQLALRRRCRHPEPEDLRRRTVEIDMKGIERVGCPAAPRASGALMPEKPVTTASPGAMMPAPFVSALVCALALVAGSSSPTSIRSSAGEERSPRIGRCGLLPVGTGTRLKPRNRWMERLHGRAPCAGCAESQVSAAPSEPRAFWSSPRRSGWSPRLAGRFKAAARFLGGPRPSVLPRSASALVQSTGVAGRER